MPEEKKTVDEDWKKHIQQEREKETEKGGKHPPIPPPSFILFISGLATQTLITLGQFENPITKKTEKNLDQARYTIDTLSMIKEKTEGNLTEEERKYLEDVLYDLRMSYISSTE
ncbi:MAG TPA: DUF1844 domain-containing protein [Candidatus Avalokitesvara rifleensis]|uniref:DUF1844 domain-containing protein n=1 Tax=Candidatus Avalokitesvara rifleensis TaxID=3367620 RepID=UPI00271246D1|nr:DUF1844 domain-containing protein [Candidatus Brocadiales bacterium]